jgi:hypothetical protein
MPKAKPAEAQPNAQDPVKVDPKHYKVEAENKQVGVLRIPYGCGKKSVMHGHPACVGVFLTENCAKFTFSGRQVGGRSQRRQ